MYFVFFWCPLLSQPDIYNWEMTLAWIFPNTEITQDTHWWTSKSRSAAIKRRRKKSTGMRSMETHNLSRPGENDDWMRADRFIFDIVLFFYIGWLLREEKPSGSRTSIILLHSVLDNISVFLFFSLSLYCFSTCVMQVREQRKKLSRQL